MSNTNIEDFSKAQLKAFADGLDAATDTPVLPATSEWAVTAAKYWFDDCAGAEGDIIELAEIIDRLAVQPAVEEKRRLIKFYIEEVARLHKRRVTAESALTVCPHAKPTGDQASHHEDPDRYA